MLNDIVSTDGYVTLGEFMKKIIFILFFWLGSLTYTYAYDDISLQLHIKGIQSNHSHFLCIYNAGCFNLSAGNKGKIFHILSEDLLNTKKIVLADTKNKRMYAQSLPTSCQRAFKNNQVLTISGNVRNKNAIYYIDRLECQFHDHISA